MLTSFKCCLLRKYSKCFNVFVDSFSSTFSSSSSIRTFSTRHKLFCTSSCYKSPIISCYVDFPINIVMYDLG